VSFVIDREARIDAPARVVWQVITDLAAYGEWNPFVPECRSSLRPGDPIEMQVRLGSGLSRQVEWITGYDEGRGFSYRMKPVPAGALCSARVHRIDAIDDTHSRYHTHFELEGWLSGLVRALMRRKLEAGFEAMTQGIRARAEQLWSAQRP
jgi:hypothetical protein